MASYILTDSADADLRNIFDYSSQQWGAAQAQKYLYQIDECAEAMGTGHAPTKHLAGMNAGVLTTRCQHHYIIAQRQTDNPLLVVAIFHERMDLVARVRDRLKP